MYYCTFFTVTIFVGCLASIGDSDKMIHIPKEVHLSFSLSIVPNDLYGRFFSSLIFSVCNITGEKKSLQ